MPTTFYVRTRDNRWISQKLSTEKSTIGNEPYIVRDKPLTEQSITYLGSIQGERDALEFYSMN